MVQHKADGNGKYKMEILSKQIELMMKYKCDELVSSKFITIPHSSTIVSSHSRNHRMNFYALRDEQFGASALDRNNKRNRWDGAKRKKERNCEIGRRTSYKSN